MTLLEIIEETLQKKMRRFVASNGPADVLALAGARTSAGTMMT